MQSSYLQMKKTQQRTDYIDAMAKGLRVKASDKLTSRNNTGSNSTDQGYAPFRVQLTKTLALP